MKHGFMGGGWHWKKNWQRCFAIASQKESISYAKKIVYRNKGKNRLNASMSWTFDGKRTDFPQPHILEDGWTKVISKAEISYKWKNGERRRETENGLTEPPWKRTFAKVSAERTFWERALTKVKHKEALFGKELEQKETLLRKEQRW